MSLQSDSFRQRYFPAVDRREWNDWRWQLRHRIRSLAQLECIFALTTSERAAVARRRQGALPLGFTPYYASLLDPADPADPLRRTMIPVVDEFTVAPGERVDPLGEEARSPVPGLVHSYPDKVLLLATDMCATYCRFCTRSRQVGSGTLPGSLRRWQPALDYIRAHPAVRDVLISGGDPLTLGDDRLEALVQAVHAIPHVEMIRIGTKIPAVLPQRITPALVNMLRRYHPLYFSIHFTHHAECTPEVAQACRRLADAGIPLGSQTVLLRGVNDDADTMKRLMTKLLQMRVRPYYLHQCDAVAGAGHFRTSLEAGEQLIQQLHGHTTGYAVPTYMLDAPGGGGKVPLTPNYVEERKPDQVRIRAYSGETYEYRYPPHSSPPDRP